MNILYVLNALAVAIVYFVYKNLEIYQLSQDDKTALQKKTIKESIMLFGAGLGCNYLLGEYFYTDLLHKLLPSKNAGKVPTEVFTDKPGF